MCLGVCLCRVGAGHRQNRLPCQSEREQTRFLREDASGPSRETKPAISKAETSHAPHRSNGSTANARDRMRQVSLGWPTFPASAHDPTSSASPPPARLDALLPHKARAAHRFASLCFPPRPRGRAVPAPAQLPVGRGLGVASCTGSSDRPHPVRVWPACNAAFLMRGAWRAQVHRIIGHIVPRSLTLRSVTGLMLIGCALTSVVSSSTCRRCLLLSVPPLELLID